MGSGPEVKRAQVDAPCVLEEMREKKERAPGSQRRNPKKLKRKGGLGILDG